MFEIPDWSEDIPKSHINLEKLLPVKNENKRKTENVQNSVSILNSKIKRNNKRLMGKAALNHNTIKDYDTDKLDEVILDAKKKKLIDSYKKEDNEETLFTEFSDTSAVKVKTINMNNNNNIVIKTSPGEKINGIKKPKKLLMQPKIKSTTKMDLLKKTLLSKKLDTDTETLKGRIERKKTNLSDIDNDKISKEKCNESKNDIGQDKEIKKDLNMSKKRLTNRKKELIKNMLQNHRNHINISNNSNKLRARMLEKLNAAKFRFLNEKLYTSSGSEAQKLFKEDPAAFHTYHQGYQQQVRKWPVNPLDVVVKKIKSMPKTHLIADMGCGEAALTKRVPHTVRSFDLMATTPDVEVCDMAHTPLLSDSMNVVVFCLALMGTDLTQYLVEANRVLKMGGHLLIAEVESRFDNVDAFAKEVQKLGFTLRKLDKTHKVFYFMEFTKAREAPNKKSKLPSLYLKPCIYKKR